MTTTKIISKSCAFVPAMALALGFCACGSKTTDSKPTTSTTTADQPTTETSEAPAIPAPGFSLPGTDGETYELASFRGKTTVLEWFNPGCPFVAYAHEKGPLANMAAEATADGNVSWIAVNSSGPGKQGHGLPLNKSSGENWKMAHPILLDDDGTVGKLYDATSTPTMIVINAEGNIVYRGALDNRPLGKGVGETINYVTDAIAALDAGSMPETRETPSYGCSVKYAGH